jgi:hypothetical protein
MNEALFVKYDRYADVDYYSEESSTDSSWDGDADDDSFTSAFERVKVDLQFLALNPEVDRTRRSFDRLLRVCDDASGVSELLSNASLHDSPDDDDISYESSDLTRLPEFELCEPSPEPKASAMSYNSSYVDRSDNYLQQQDEEVSQMSTQPPGLDEVTDTSTFCSYQDFSIQSLSSPKRSLASSEEIDHSIDLVRDIKERLRNIRQFSLRHSPTITKAECPQVEHVNTPQEKHTASHAFERSNPSEDVSERMEASFSRVRDIKSRLRNLENFSNQAPSLCDESSRTDEIMESSIRPCLSDQTHRMRTSACTEKCERPEPTNLNALRRKLRTMEGCRMKSSVMKSVASRESGLKSTNLVKQKQQEIHPSCDVLSEYEIAMIESNDRFADALVRISRDIMLFLFTAFCMYMIYSIKRDRELDALQMEIQKMNLVGKALTIVQQRDNWQEAIIERNSLSPFQRFFEKLYTDQLI